MSRKTSQNGLKQLILDTSLYEMEDDFEVTQSFSAEMIIIIANFLVLTANIKLIKNLDFLPKCYYYNLEVVFHTSRPLYHPVFNTYTTLLPFYLSSIP